MKFMLQMICFSLTANSGFVPGLQVALLSSHAAFPMFIGLSELSPGTILLLLLLLLLLLFTYLLACLLTYLLACLFTYLLIYWLAYLLTYFYSN